MDIETIKSEFCEIAKQLIDYDPYISLTELLANEGIIPPSRLPRPSPDQIEAAGYRHNGTGKILGKKGGILKGTTNNQGRNFNGKWTEYRIHGLDIKGYGKKQWWVTEHQLVFTLVHRRWARDGYVIDHIDNNPENNHPNNLREVTQHSNNYVIKEKNSLILNGIKTDGPLSKFFN